MFTHNEKLELEQAVSLIQRKESFDPKDFNFHIDKTFISTYIESGDSPNFENFITREETLLHIAIKNSNEDAVRKLISAGADIQIPTKITESRRQLILLSGNASSLGAIWSTGKAGVRKEQYISSFELGNKTGNQGIIQAITEASIQRQTLS